MTEMKKYQSIVRHGKKGTHLTLEDGSDIVIMEKLDGANASFLIGDGKLRCFSRNTELDPSNTLRGFYEWVQSLTKEQQPREGLILFGEWLCRHKLDYGENENKFYLFDVYDTEKEEYLSFDEVSNVADQLDLLLVPVFYAGKFQSMEHILSFVGKSELGEKGEGVVVKNYSYRDRYGKQLFTKFVSDEFSEMQNVKKQKIKTQADALDEFVNNTVTKARVQKILHKLVDEDIIKEDYAIEDMGSILKGFGSRIVDDVIEEELDVLLKVLKQKISRKVPSVVKEVLAEEGRA